MSENDNIEDLFSSKLENFESPVSDALWTSISQNIGNTVAASATTAGKAIFSNFLITASVAVATGVIATVVTISIMSDAEKDNGNVFVNEKAEIQFNLPEERKEPLIDNTSQNLNLPIEEPIDAEDPLVEKEISTEVYKVTPKQEEKKDYHREPSAISSFMTSPADLKRQEEARINTANEEVVSKEELVYDDHSITITKSEVVASIVMAPVGGYAPLNVYFSCSGEEVKAVWDLGDGTISREKEVAHTFDEPGSYVVELMLIDEYGNKSTDKRIVEVLPTSSITNIPNVVTPNGDGKNDLFSIKGDNIEEYHLFIINSKGEEVYESNEMDDGWNGMDKFGNPAPKGTYFFVLKAVGGDGKRYEHSGPLKLNR